MKHELTSQRIRKALSDNNMKAQELSDRSGVGKASISQYVNGSHQPSNIAASKIGKVLNVNPLWLMGLDDDMSPEQNVNIPEYIVGSVEVMDLYSKITPEQRIAVLNLLRSFVNQE